MSKDNVDYQHYLSQLDSDPVIARIKIPTIDVDLPIYHGTTEDVLKKGVGHLFGTSLPVGGENTHSVLTGHTGLSTATLFDDLIDVGENDHFYIEVQGRRMKYEVFETKTVLPDQTEGLTPRAGEDLITLITCTPYGVNTHRYLVTARQVPMNPSEDSIFDDKASIWQWWMKLIVAIAAIILLLLIYWILRMRRKQKQNEESTEHSAYLAAANSPVVHSDATSAEAAGTAEVSQHRASHRRHRRGKGKGGAHRS